MGEAFETGSGSVYRSPGSCADFVVRDVSAGRGLQSPRNCVACEVTDLSYYKRNLPHRLPPGQVLFITFRLANTLPVAVLERLREEADLAERLYAEDATQRHAAQKRHFAHFDELLAGVGYGPTWLGQPAVAELVAASLHHFDGVGYELLSYCIMPNHVHLLVALPPEAPLLMRTLQRLKGYTALQANKLLKRTGAFWQSESYDHVVRSGELERILSYILHNPVKAGLATEWQQWPYTYIAPALR